MIRINNANFDIDEIKKEKALDNPVEQIETRPDIVQAKVYKLRSGFVKHNVYITLGYIEQNGRKRPIEIFINSKDLTKYAEYAVLTRLISAIFRKTANPVFILEELSSIHDPNGGYFKNGKFIYSLYSEIADVMQQFFKEIGCQDDKDNDDQTGFIAHVEEALNEGEQTEVNAEFTICPDCNQKSVKMENGCLICIDPNCGYSKCDK